MSFPADPCPTCGIMCSPRAMPTHRRSEVCRLRTQARIVEELVRFVATVSAIRLDEDDDVQAAALAELVRRAGLVIERCEALTAEHERGKGAS